MDYMIAEVEGLLFEHSPVGLAAQLRLRPGIQSVQVNAVTGRARIGYDAARLQSAELPRLISECGYEPTRRIVSTRPTDAGPRRR
jgi:hypothetical protein